MSEDTIVFGIEAPVSYRRYREVIAGLLWEALSSRGTPVRSVEAARVRYEMGSFLRDHSGYGWNVPSPENSDITVHLEMPSADELEQVLAPHDPGGIENGSQLIVRADGHEDRFFVEKYFDFHYVANGVTEPRLSGLVLEPAGKERIGAYVRFVRDLRKSLDRAEQDKVIAGYTLLNK